MKQDWDLLRVLLAAIESETLAAFLKDAEKVEAWKEGQLLSERNKAKQNAGLRIVLLHLKMLIDDGMVTGVRVRYIPISAGYGYDFDGEPLLTSRGYKLLATLRSDGVWDKMRDLAKSKGIELTFDTVQTLASAVIRKMIGE